MQGAGGMFAGPTLIVFQASAGKTISVLHYQEILEKKNQKQTSVSVSDLVFGHHVSSVDQRRSDGRFVLQRLAQ